ncbi:bifunctional diaminohydroxyphosphoribosylaminopyrimidine deaminase/5-amino-6-(5-phosphoribosylamino)uracil reductase RibD [Methylocaldum sp. RMAD-M]|jgi:diaminohydroxyphosphoribosylaminopyrimidine deaminase/5-amino-6-(5-phosphoribosylamino)uracil reductase|uniref:bifunctional diaminohydroxyphosphoribosylaminopyrimidine deaminase/5-amino-6-(5-phosphoribosylamino)uracil reductase RibD n=1 Tax=Methylocaldum sp. RMAD-M TaxID=2806557 RepID=UPI000A3286D7|nr:bifunctional diaminohydroxyphosphoribosylaminopyrimidine deaminase/5-amino-6-(5-phosphoribosylamino)uracil reductase RibD [Methylocaldum sp. RMAD-M]MBP1149150.1 diaminohydroxyphosphoribosylaminopyrimidine deaminase/5-amino-6-(5-phosphoribosylamino)uracil reductase [Methylocaldum sp. RMAD-M]
MELSTVFAREDAEFMSRALHLAERGLYTTDPNPRVGCVIVKDGQIVGEGWHRQAGGPHAEVEALRQSGARAYGATAYVSLEPCCHHGKTPPCTDALISAGIARVVAAMKDPNPRVAGEGLKTLRDAGVDVACGLLENAAAALNPGFCKRMKTGRPYIRSKLAMSLDGRTALPSGESKWITGEDARRDAHRLRARSSAIVTGIGTALQDDPELTARLPEAAGEILQPVRVVLDSRLRMPASMRLAGGGNRAVVLTTVSDEERTQTLSDSFDIETLPATLDGRLDLTAVVDWLGHHQFNEVLVEAGPTLNGALLRENLVDEWVIYLAPVVLGDKARGLFHLPDLTRMAERFELTISDVRQVGRDLRLTLLRQ